jgi:penicillin-binding protein 1A
MVAGVFVGFDDNRSLGEGETGAVAAVPIYIDFMREALKGQAKTDFKPPKNTRFVTVSGHREAFRPGQEPEPTAPTAPRDPNAPIPYDKLPTDNTGLKPGQSAPAAAPPPKKVRDDLKGLY